MASGIEILGVVLGALPLFISAAEHYRDGLGFVRRARRKHKFITQYRDELLEQRTLLGLYTKAVVGSTDLPARTQAELIDKPDGEAWRMSDVVKELSKALGDAYQRFLVLMNEICTTLAKQLRSDEVADPAETDDEIVKKLQDLCLDARKKEASTDNGMRDVWNRIEFSWRHPQRESLLNELKDYTERLLRLSSAANGAKPYERKQQTRKAHATFELRDDAEKLYKVMCKACSCQPLRQREVGLGLAVHHQDGATKSDLCFQLLLFDSNDSVCSMFVKMVKPSEPCEPAKKKVRFSISTNHGNPCDEMKKLQDICKESQLAQKSKAHLQLVVDEKGEVYTTQRGRLNTSPETDSVQSLCEVMSNFQLYDHKRWLHREKAILAVILAYSLLQLHESSWWQSLWNSHSISFLSLNFPKLTTCRSPDQRIKLRRPFTRSMVEAGLSPSPPPSPSQPTRKNAHLHALGIVLLELYLNRSIKDDVDAQGGSDYRGVAHDLLEEHSDDINMTAEYARAVRFCLSPHPNPYSGSFSFEDKGFREIFYSEVISMLEDNLKSRFEVNDSIWVDDDD